MQQPDPWGFDEAPVETWADILAPAVSRPRAAHRVHRPRDGQLQAQERAAEVRDVRRRDRLHGLREELPDFDHQHLQRARLELADRQVQPGLVPVLRLHRGLDDPVGAPVLRARLRLRRADADARCDPAREVARRGAAIDREARGVDQVRHPRRRDRVLPRHARPADLPVHRAVLDVRPVRHADDVDGAGGPADGDALRPQPVLPVPLSRSARRSA